MKIIKKIAEILFNILVFPIGLTLACVWWCKRESRTYDEQYWERRWREDEYKRYLYESKGSQE